MVEEPAAESEAMTPPHTPTVEILSIGDELLAGRTLDSNAAELARLLAERGQSLTWHQTVGDKEADIVAALDVAASRSALVVVSGGLGPTSDDVTRAAAARWAAVPLVTLPDADPRYTVPASAQALANPVGTAGGFSLRRGDTSLVFLPGVPVEFVAMLPAALAALGLGEIGGESRRELVVSVFGLRESEIDQLLRPLERGANVRIHYNVRFPVVRVRVAASGAAAADPVWSALCSQVRDALGRNAYAEADCSLAETVVGWLARHGLRVATAESCTGGLIGHLLTEVPGVSEHFAGGFVVYANTAKESMLGVPATVLAREGAVSRATVEHMARAARERLDADLAVAVSGIAGPGGGSPEKPVGTVHMALAGPDGVGWTEHLFTGGRTAIKQRAAHAALDMIRRHCEELAT